MNLNKLTTMIVLDWLVILFIGIAVISCDRKDPCLKFKKQVYSIYEQVTAKGGVCYDVKFGKETKRFCTVPSTLVDKLNENFKRK